MAPVRAHLVDEPLDVPRVGLGLGRDADEGHLLEVIPVGEVGERRMARHDLATLAASEPAGELLVELLEPFGERVRRLRTAEGSGDRAGDLPVAQRVEPDVRVGLALLAVEQLDLPEDVERSPRTALDGVLDGRLEPAARVDDERRVAQPLDVAGAQLEVVRLGAGRGQVDDLASGRRHLPHRVRERVEGGDEGAAGIGRPTAARRNQRRDTGHTDENDSRNHGCGGGYQT